MKRILIALVAVLGLVGCVAIPDAGPVVQGQVDTDQQSNDLLFLPPGPEEGATQEEIILGFLTAAINPSDDFEVAREYLSGLAAATWNPNARVIVRSGVQPEISLSGETETEASAVVSALSELDAGGALRLTGGDRMLEFALAQIEGEWRIVEAPEGIVLSAYYFDQLFRAHTLSWVTPDGTRAVPEVRWFERTASTLKERIVDALLRGPSAWLAPAVTTYAAPDAALVGPPRITGTTMTVTLGAVQLEQLPSASLVPLAAQLARSLQDVGVREVRVEVEGISGFISSTEAEPVDQGSVDQRPLVLEGDELRSVGGGTSMIDDVGPTLAEIGATSFTVGAAGGIASTGTAATWIVPGADPVVVSTAVGAVPTVDDSGWVLLQERGAAQRLVAWRDGERVELALPPGSNEIAAMELSRDGTRLAVVTSDGSTSAVWVLAVVRDVDGRPVSLGEPYPMPGVEGAGTDITWVSPTQVAVLATDDDAAQIAVLTIGGVSEQLPTPNGPVRAIVGGSEGTATLRALGAEGSLLSLRDRVWSPANGLDPIQLMVTQQ
ncbi:Sporulation and spore germination [Agrococcus baldri]|uniref:Sporulation and spore germination n=1 Tax=Agrococcus baldri TaxID=153730 RepID=A0AA94KYJ7_9MICO|nr:LpqB family beta-propeller domain-containing protein [Agrococcus baldri]SFR99445.1 Sporulation and spore germination [Agrococcus baldri]